jgi:hypothetical protein
MIGRRSIESENHCDDNTFRDSMSRKVHSMDDMRLDTSLADNFNVHYDDDDNGDFFQDNNQILSENSPKASERNSISIKSPTRAVQLEAKPYSNPLALLDPHVPAPHKSKPVQRAKTFVLPEDRAKFRHFSLDNDDLLDIFDESISKSGKPCLSKSMRNIFKKGKNIESNAVTKRKRPVDVDAFLRVESEKHNTERSQGLPTVSWGEMDDGDAYSDNDNFGEFPATDMDHSEFNAAFSANVDTALKSAGYDNVDSDTHNYNSFESDFTTTFENLCRQHISNFMRGANDYARETNLSRRVGEWTSRLEPILQAQEQRPEFDIHCYSDKTLNIVASKVAEKDTGDDVHFSEIVRKQPQYEKCRMFLACLQLANLGNVTFTQNNKSSFDFEVHLLSNTSNRLHFEDYVVPSLINY